MFAIGIIKGAMVVVVLVMLYYVVSSLIHIYVMNNRYPWRFRIVRMLDRYAIQYRKKGVWWVTMTSSERWNKSLEYLNADRSPRNLYFEREVDQLQPIIDDFKIRYIVADVERKIKARAKSKPIVIRGDE